MVTRATFRQPAFFKPASAEGLSRRLAAEAGRLLLVLAAMSLTPGVIAFTAWRDTEALRSEWTITGPACPEVAAPSAAVVGRKPPKVFVYGGAQFSRAFGAVYCAAIPQARLWSRANDYVCQFNNPGAVTVDSGGTRTTFQGPPGGRLTVSVRGGTASCVVGGWFVY